ncbi:MAG: extensin family protein [Hyphomicrobiales bacterium]
MSRSACTVLLGAALLVWSGQPTEASSKKYCFFEMESMCPGRQPQRGSKIRKPKPKTETTTKAPIPTPKPEPIKAAVPIPKAKPDVPKAATVSVDTSTDAQQADETETKEAPPAAPEPKPDTAKVPEPKPETAVVAQPTPPEPEPAVVEPPEPEPKPNLAEAPEPTPPRPEPKPEATAPAEPAPPTPEAKPTTTEPTPPAPSTGIDQTSAADAAACRADLTKLGVTFTQAAATDFAPCNIDNAVQLESIKADNDTVTFIGKPIFNCNFARKFSGWVADVAVPVVQSLEDKALSGLSTGPGFDCRNRNGDTTAKISEHASGNAVDIDQIVLADKSRIAISQVANTNDPHYRMLMALRTSACGYFTTVLGPGSNAAHASHYHLDLGIHGKSGNYRICE